MTWVRIPPFGRNNKNQHIGSDLSDTEKCVNERMNVPTFERVTGSGQKFARGREQSACAAFVVDEIKRELPLSSWLDRGEVTAVRIFRFRQLH